MHTVEDVIDLKGGVSGVITEVHENAEIPMFDVMISGDENGEAVTMVELVTRDLVPLAFYQMLSTGGSLG
jgi:hypothetical protein